MPARTTAAAASSSVAAALWASTSSLIPPPSVHTKPSNFQSLRTISRCIGWTWQGTPFQALYAAM